LQPLTLKYIFYKIQHLGMLNSPLIHDIIKRLIKLSKEEKMHLSKRLVLLFFVVVVTVFVASPTKAAWGAGWGTGSVIGFGTVTGLKNAQNNGASVTATIGAYGAAVVNGSLATGNISGIAWCQNQGGNLAPGANSVSINTNFSATQYIGSDQIDQNGQAPFNVHAEASPSLISPAAACPNSNWAVVDFIPQAFTGMLQGYDASGQLLTRSVYDCQISWSVLQSLGYHQQSAYTCTERLDQRVN
jgi:hypothetical protein